MSELIEIRVLLKLPIRHQSFNTFCCILSMMVSLLFATKVWSDEPSLFSPAPQARPIDVLDGLALGEVHAITQDKIGYIWIGTDNGLVRYDGYNAALFAHDPQDKYSISHNIVMDIVEDKNGNLWISTYGGGLNKYSAEFERFEKISLKVNDNDRSASDLLYHLSLDESGILWIGSENGLSRLNTENNQALPLPAGMSDLPNTPILQAFFDSHQEIWFTTAQSGVYRYGDNKLQHFFTFDGQVNGLIVGQIRSVFEDQKGNLWFGSGQGLHLFDREQQSIKSAISNQNSTIAMPGFTIRAMAQDHQGKIWLGTQSNGIQRFSSASGEISTITGAMDIKLGFKSERINDIFADKDGSLWFATDEGIIFLAKAALDFSYLTNQDGALTVTDIELLHNEEVAFTGNYQYYDYDLQNQSLTQKFTDKNRLYRISRIDESQLLFATLDQGLQRYSLTQNQISQLPLPTAETSNQPITGLFDTFVDNKNNIWLLPFPDLPHLAGGILRYDSATKHYQHYLSSPFFSDIIQLSEHELLLSSDSAGLITLDTQSKMASRWQQSISTTPRRIVALFKDSSDTLWLGTRNQGLAKYDKLNKRFTFYGIKEGLLSNNVHSIVEDKNHDLWLGTDFGLSRFTPSNAQVMNIQKKDGLLFSTFYKRAATVTDKGKLLFGTHSGLVTLEPSDFIVDATFPRVLISDFKLFNQSYDWRNSADENLPNQPMCFTEELVLVHKNNMFSFDFSAIEYLRPDKIRFAYKMEGLNDQWVYTDSTHRFASYTTLPYGEYTFKVKASNRFGQWGEEVASVKVVVKPPWWQSQPAYIAYLVLSALSIVVFTNFRTKQLITRAHALEQRVDERTKELKTSRDQVAELLAQKQQLFASVSHEFRTPLTLILSPVDLLLKERRGQAVAKELGLIKRNGRRLLRMVDQLLEFAKLEMKDDSQMEPVSLKQTLDIIVSSFESLVKTKQIKMHVNTFEDVKLLMLPDSLNKILINLLSNAFKYSPQHSEIFVTVTAVGQTVEVAIRDTGIGIAQSDLETVFQRFNRATHNHGESIPGAGIGLALVKELVEANHGQIALSSELDKGSIFTVILPIAADQSAQTLMTSNDADGIHQNLDLEIDSISNVDTIVESLLIDEEDSQTKSILIVDDNPDLRNLLCQQLSEQYQCILAENGQIGLTLARQHLPDLVISDVMMPVMDGYQLTSSLKNDELTSHIPVILLTAKGSMEARLKGLQLLVDDYLAKPFNMEELTLRIRNILAIRDIIKQKFKRVIDESNPQPQMDQLGINEIEQSFIKRVNEQLSKLYTEADLNAKVMSRELGVSERQLQRKLKSQFDLGFVELVRNYRLNKAMEMLTAGHRASQIYHLVGFSSHSYFTSCFKAKFGQPPKEFQQEVEK